MKKILFVTLSIFVLLFSCNHDDDNNDEANSLEPRCLQSFVDTYFESYEQPSTPKASIEKYLYNEQEVFVLNFQNFPDGQSSVVNENCEVICVLGGIDGPMNDCEDWDSAEYIETVWTDPR